MVKISIQEYSEEYKEAVIDLILDIQQNEFAIPIKIEDQPDLNSIPDFYQIKGGNFWIALCNQQVVGTISMLDIGNHQGALRKMFVKAAYRGGGYSVATLLLQTLINGAREHGIRDIYLGTTEKFLAAHRFYEKNKFVQIDKMNLTSDFPIMKVDTRFYKYKV